jgi:myosin heavy subunit
MKQKTSPNNLEYFEFPTRRDKDIFIVKHYAGPVMYLPTNFLEKNVETLRYRFYLSSCRFYLNSVLKNI